jgi:hypothetical protein
VRRAALIALVALAGCGGGDEGGSDSATDLLDRGFATDVDTGVLTIDAELDLEGGPFEEPFRLEVEGPFRSPETIGRWPDMDMAFRASGAGKEYEGRAITTRANAWVEFDGETYEVGEALWRQLRAAVEQLSRNEPDTLGELDIDPLDWITDARKAGSEKLGGTTTTKVTGRLDADRMLRDINLIPGGEPLTESELRQAEEVVGDTEFQAWIGEDDIWRRLSIESDLRVPEAERESLGGIAGGTVSLDFELDEPNQPVEIRGPMEGRPIDELLRRLGVPPEQLFGPGFAQPAPG